MRRRLTQLLHLLCITLLLEALNVHRADASHPRRAAPKPAVHWQHGLKAAHEISVRDNKPILLVFGATWCGPCKKLESETLSHPDLAQYINEHFIPVHLDLDDNEKIAEILEVESIPAVLVLSPSADLLGRQTGFAEPQKFYENIFQAEQLHLKAQPVGRAQLSPATPSNPGSSGATRPPVRSASNPRPVR